MRNFDKTAAQGEVNFEIVENLPEGLKPFEATGPHYIIGHSESGNHHVLERDDVEVFTSHEKTPSGMEVLYAIAKNPTTAKQTGTGSPHGEIAFNAGDVIRITPSIDYDHYAKERAIRRAAD